MSLWARAVRGGGVLATVVLLAAAAPPERLETRELGGHIGPYRIGMALRQRGDLHVDGGHYFYTKHMVDIPLTGRVEGGQMILTGQDGGVFKLHFVNLAGKPVPDLYNATGLAGVWVRGAQTLPVELDYGSMGGGAPTRPSAAPRERVSVVYCEKFSVGGSAFFAAKERRDGALEFSFSNWTPNGNRAGIGGTAQRHGDAWVYRSMDNASKPGRPCVARIRVNGKAGARITAEPLDACDGGQGHGASIGSVDFPPEAYGGPAPNDAPSVSEDDLGPICG